jgi:HD-GYP domain-containing protein (c-di-GMP phosphodiesterase class II)
MKVSSRTDGNVSGVERSSGRVESLPKPVKSEDSTRVTAELCPPDALLYNSRIIASFLRFVERFYSHVDANEVLYYAKMAPYQVEDEDHWFNQEQVDLFYEKLVKLTQNQNLARDAGRYAVSTDSLGVVQSYALGFVNPAKLYDMISKASANLVRSCVWEAMRLGPNKMQITVTPRPGTHEKLYQCENRMGYLEAICAMFKHKLPSIEHTECTFKEGKCCRYVITWRTFRSDVWRKSRNWLIPPLSAASLSLLYFSGPKVWVTATVASLAAAFVLSHIVWHMQKEELLKAIGNLTDSTDALFEKLNVSYNNSQMIHEIGVSLTRQRHIEGILKDVAQILERRLDYDRGMILFADNEKTVLNFKAGFGYTEDQLAFLRKASFRMRLDSKGILVVCFRERRPFLINDIDEIRSDLTVHSLEFAREMGVKSFICCPIVCVDDTLGVLAVDNVKTKRLLLQSDIDLLMALSPEIGIGIQNAMTTDMKERQFNSILEVLASSIDARDPLTAGHSERVTRFAMGTSEELALPKEYCEMIRVASLLHDYGKIAIKDSILKKPGSLTPDEYREIRMHAAKTKEILEKVQFEGIYKEVPEIAASHHEKWDGTGYPRGLKSEEIPLGARILAVADVFEAITSERHYRGPMPIHEACDLLVGDKGKHFDPSVVDAFLRYYETRGQSLESLARESVVPTTAA